ATPSPTGCSGGARPLRPWPCCRTSSRATRWRMSSRSWARWTRSSARSIGKAHDPAARRTGRARRVHRPERDHPPGDLRDAPRAQVRGANAVADRPLLRGPPAWVAPADRGRAQAHAQRGRRPGRRRPRRLQPRARRVPGAVHADLRDDPVRPGARRGGPEHRRPVLPGGLLARDRRALHGWLGVEHQVRAAVGDAGRQPDHLVRPPLIFAALVPVLLAGSLQMSAIVAAQQGLWFVFYPVIGQLAFVAYLVATLAAENRVPFDILEAESELVAGFRVEYSGMKFALIQLGE